MEKNRVRCSACADPGTPAGGLKSDVTEDVYASSAYKKTRTAYHMQCAAEYLVSLVVADAFLAKLLKHIGLPDAVIGIVASLTSLAFLVQLATIFLMQHIRNVKRTVILLDSFSMLCFLATYLLPFFSAGRELRTVLVFLTVGGGFLLKYLQLNLYYKWGNSFVRPEGRGAFAARNEAISLAVGVVFSLSMGAMVDHFDKRGELDRSFLVIACVIAVLAVLNLILLLQIRPYSTEDALRQQKPFKEVLQNTLGNKSFRHVIIMVCLYDIARYMTIGFLGTFKTQDLLFSVGTVQLINVTAQLMRCVLSRPAGKWADRTSFAHVFRMGLWLCAVSFGLLIFTTPYTRWLIVGYSVLHNVALAATGANVNNMSYSYVPIDFFVQAQAVRSSIAGTAGFLASIVGSRILAAVQARGNLLFSRTVYGQQVLAAISLILTLAAIFYCKFVVEKQKVMKQ